MFIRVNAFPLCGHALKMLVICCAQQYQNVRLSFLRNRCIHQSASQSLGPSLL